MTPDQKNLLVQAYAILKNGDPHGAEVRLAPYWNAQADPPAAAHHLLGLIRRAQGRIPEAEVLLRTAIQKEPAQAEYHNSLGITLRSIGFEPEAEASFRAALKADPGYWQASINLASLLNVTSRAEEAEALLRPLTSHTAAAASAWIGLARALLAQRRWGEAKTAAQNGLTRKPGSADARETLAIALARMGQWQDAEPHFQAIANAKHAGVEGLVSWGKTLAEEGRLDEAQVRFEEAVRRAPQTVNAQSALAQLRYLRGETKTYLDAALDALKAAPDNLGLRMQIALMMRQADRNEDALALLRAAPPTQFSAHLDTSLSVVESLVGDKKRAVELADRALAAQPNNDMMRLNAAAAHIIAGDPRQAIAHAEWGLARKPHDQDWLSFMATASRAAGDPRYKTLYNYDQFVGAYDLATPAGYASIEAFNTALADRLRQLHIYSAHPLDQSLRGGTQTPVSLLDSEDPVIRAFLAALDQPIRAHMAKIGAAKGHPLTERNTGAYRFRGCWSVRLTHGGSHVNHVHPEGWLSSAYYVTVPPDVQDANAKTGWLTFGEPRFTQANLPPAHYVQPRVGRLALFPSYMWHGVRPFTAGAERMTIAFDVVPA